jgi:uncharacterized protein
MGQVVNFEASAVANLRARMAEVEAANHDLIAFARGHSDVVAAIHATALSAISADGLDELIRVMTQDWPGLLKVDAIALALVAEQTAFRADQAGLTFIDPRIVLRATQQSPEVVLRGVERGHPLFGAVAPFLRAEAIIPLHGALPLPHGLLLLGQRHQQDFATRHGAELLAFLGAVVSATVKRWLLPN